jgi:ABC-type bacteriocin/lantibiotic exporter with double-glycine peptidase domain
MVLAYLGQELAETDIAHLLGTDETGTSFANISRVEALGYQVTLGSGIFDDLAAVGSTGIPLITAVDTFFLYAPPGGAHCVVVAGATASEVAVYDPDRSPAPIIVQAESFEAAWRRRRFRMAAITR